MVVWGAPVAESVPFTALLLGTFSLAIRCSALMPEAALLTYRLSATSTAIDTTRALGSVSVPRQPSISTMSRSVDVVRKTVSVG